MPLCNILTAKGYVRPAGIIGVALCVLGLLGAAKDANDPIAIVAFVVGCGVLFVSLRSQRSANGLVVDVQQYSSANTHDTVPLPRSNAHSPNDLTIWYEDHIGDLTKRRITPIRIDQQLQGYGASPRLHAYCHLRQEERTFSIKKILMFKDAESEQPLFDVFVAVESRLNIKTANPEKDAWEGYDYEKDSVRRVHGELNIRYEDSAGQRSERDISLHKYATNSAGKYLLIAHCHLRNDTRSFHVDQILGCIDRETGEEIYDLDEDLDARYAASPDGALSRLVDVWRPAVVAMLFIARADGRLMRAERRIIAGLCRFLANDVRLTDELIDKMIDNLVRPTEADFTGALSELSTRELVARKAILRGAELLLATDKRVTEEERRLLRILRGALEKSASEGNP